MLAGASDFYTAILNKKFIEQRTRKCWDTVFLICIYAEQQLEESKKNVNHIQDKTNCVVYINHTDDRRRTIQLKINGCKKRKIL